MPRFFIASDLSCDQTIVLTETVFKHWVKVLRAECGDQATLFNGQGGEYLATLVDINKKQASVRLEQFTPDNRTPYHRVCLGQVMSKGDRMDYAIQKATELGVHQIQLLTSERCEMRLKYDRDQKKIEHWQAIAIAACEQCGMNIVPEILPPLALADWLASSLPKDRLVMAPQQHNNPQLSQLSQDVALLIGPEGGLSTAEIAAAQAQGFQAWSIGERILRTETAPVVALSILLHYSEQKL
ncbi:16S rRNA (uracil(1498)-N(3))-methyltransferase [Acinetobacter larvae]|uniref:Ribosomal RNA small subunit methyltransferase E n=1 Tax=Acinetobacter larvae TaxID=1789224 RepID=A0A1B2M1H6_9GAMM|nr:16S rRNA (uracil(1498)-N(3))-methyltransferase [Acinetobacter larvae]AOA59044.1 16S rRNA (uracil(1498)-N(3))-methyltransferase [Acinetobacter larvae]